MNKSDAIKKSSFENGVKFIMKTINGCERLEHLTACDELIKIFMNQHKENPKAPFLKAQLDGMVVFREFQFQIESEKELEETTS